MQNDGTFAQEHHRILGQHLAGNLPLALVGDMIGMSRDGGQREAGFAFRHRHGETMRIFLRDEARGQTALAPALVLHQRG